MRTKSSPTPLGYSTKFHTGWFRPMVQLFTLLYTILIDKAPLSCTILLKRVTPRENEGTLIFSWLLLSLPTSSKNTASLFRTFGSNHLS